MRTIEILPDNDVVSIIAEKVGYSNLQAAVGYLSRWNLNFPIVKIYMDSRDQGMEAAYFNADRTQRYVIGAVWHEDEQRYSFHS